jgi:hypothetical protein
LFKFGSRKELKIMFLSDYSLHKAYKTPEEREKIRQQKKHQETCAKNRKKRKSKKKNKK